MSMSDCPKCWNTPCSCGWEYRNYSIEYLITRRKLFDIIIKFKKKNEHAKFSQSFIKPESEDDIRYIEYIDKQMNDFMRRGILTIYKDVDLEKIKNQKDKILELEEKIKSQKRELFYKDATLKERTKELDALHRVWCTGCDAGVHHYPNDKEINEELVSYVERYSRRLRTWFEIHKGRKSGE